jgi:hypothetical protein
MSDTKQLNINGPLAAMAARIAMQVESLQKRINDLSGSTNRNLSSIGDDSYDSLRIVLTAAETEVRRISNKAERDSKNPGRRTGKDTRPNQKQNATQSKARKAPVKSTNAKATTDKVTTAKKTSAKTTAKKAPVKKAPTVKATVTAPSVDNTSAPTTTPTTSAAPVMAPLTNSTMGSNFN